jgi:hypothetical protein
MAHGMSGADVRTRGATRGHPIARQADARSKNAIKNENNIALNPRGATRTRSHAAAKLSTRAFASSRNRFAAFGGVRPFEHCVAKAPELETRKARPYCRITLAASGRLFSPGSRAATDFANLASREYAPPRACNRYCCMGPLMAARSTLPSADIQIRAIQVPFSLSTL